MHIVVKINFGVTQKSGKKYPVPVEAVSYQFL